jgi:putative methyltransferase (TIGR04325 family)
MNVKKLKVLSLLLIIVQVFGTSISYATTFNSRLLTKASRLANIQVKSYKSFDEALKHCQKSGYENRDIVEVVAQKNAILRAQMKNNQFLDSVYLRAVTGVALALEVNKLRVIDFGGGGGSHYTIARSVLDPKIKLRWNVVETNAMVEAANYLRNDELNFFNDIQSAVDDLESVDLVLTSGTLHCTKNPYDFLQKLIAVEAQYLFITRTSFNDGSETLINVQKSLLSDNGPGPLPSGFVDKVVFYPNVFIPLAQVETALRSTYNIKFKSLEDKDVYRIGNISINMYGYFCEKKV